VPWSPNATVKINGTAVTNYTLEGVQISMGRDDVQQQSSAGFATIDFLNLPYTDVEIFDTIQVTLDNFTGVDTTIFTGLVTDVSVSVLDAGTTNTFITQISASGGLSELAAKEANLVGYAEQKDGDRIVSVITDTFGLKWNELPATQVWTDYTTETWDSLLGVDISAIDTPGTYDLFSSLATPEPLNALNYVQIVADSGSGYIYETTSGGIGYQDQDARADYVSANGFVNISKNFILADGISVTTSRNDIINDVIVVYGAAEDAVQTEELDSISQYGRVTQTIQTFLKNQTDAETLADRLVLLNAYPQPVIQGIQIQIDAPTMTSSLLNSLVGVFFGMPVSVTDFPALLYPNQFFGYVEGWEWNIDRFTARLTLNVSDFTFSAVPVAWQDVFAGEIWSTIDPSLQWQDALLGVN
jgi:dihydroneopterin aldolase